jgi:hypothetical protein
MMSSTLICSRIRPRAACARDRSRKWPISCAALRLRARVMNRCWCDGGRAWMGRPIHWPRVISVRAAATDTVIVFRGRPSRNSIQPSVAARVAASPWLSTIGQHQTQLIVVGRSNDASGIRKIELGVRTPDLADTFDDVCDLESFDRRTRIDPYQHAQAPHPGRRRLASRERRGSRSSGGRRRGDDTGLDDESDEGEGHQEHGPVSSLGRYQLSADESSRCVPMRPTRMG